MGQCHIEKERNNDMLTKRLIDASPFDKLIISVPDDIYDAFSYIRGIEDILAMIRSAKTENDSMEEMSE